ncbi:hypothetical protein GLP37_18525 [Photobacterium phosphoreum]|nr:hypothetical protein [Photobacterium phosphoreum]
MNSIHIAIIFMLIAFYFCSFLKFKVEKIISSILFVLFIVYYASNRNIYWGDTNNYRAYFYNTSLNDFEWGFHYLVEFFSTFNLGFHNLLIFISFFISLCYVVSIIKYIELFSDKKSTGILSCILSVSIICFHTYYMNFEAIRDGISSSILIFAFYYLIRGEDKKYIFIAIIAAMFHKTVFLFLFLPWLIKIEIKPKLFLFLCISLLLSSNLLVVFLTKTTLLPEAITHLFEFYSKNSSQSKTVLIRYLLIIFGMIFLYGNDKNKKYSYKVYLIFVWVILISFVFSAFPDMFRRILIKVEYISYPILILGLFRVNNVDKKIILLLLSGVFYLLFFSDYIAFYNLINVTPLFNYI